MSAIYVDKNLKKITREEWISLNESKDYPKVAKTSVTYLKDTYEVVTVWIGYDKDHNKDNKYLPFGTRVFKEGTSTDLAGFELKAENIEKALALHEKICNQCEKGKFYIDTKKELENLKDLDEK